MFRRIIVTSKKISGLHFFTSACENYGGRTVCIYCITYAPVPPIDLIFVFKKKRTKKNLISKFATVYRKKPVVISSKCKSLRTFPYLIYQKLSGSCLGSLHLQCIFTDYSKTSRPINTETFVRNVHTLNINWIEVSPIYSLQQGCPNLFPWGGLNLNLMVDHLTPIVMYCRDANGIRIPSSLNWLIYFTNPFSDYEWMNEWLVILHI